MGGVVQLDLHNRQLVGFMFQSPLPKTILFHLNLEEAEKVFVPAVQLYLNRLLPYLAQGDQTADALGFFGLSRNDLPAVVIHDTQREKWFVLKPTGGWPSTEQMHDFYDSYFAGTLPPASNPDRGHQHHREL